jgi:hypothetical protein
MKKITLSVLWLFCGLVLFSQTIESLKKENVNLKQDTAYLRQVIRTCDLLKKSSDYVISNTNRNVKIEVLSCIGDRYSQTVTIDLMVSHQLPHQKLSIHTGSGAPTAFDNLGNSFQYKSVDFQNMRNPYGVVEVVIPTDIRIKGSITFRNVLPATENFSFARFDYNIENQDGGHARETYKVEIKNIQIIWK